MARPNGALLLTLGVGESSVFRRLGSLGIDSSNGDTSVTPVEKQQDKDDLTLRPSATSDNSDSGFPSTSIIIIAVGVVVLFGLVFLLVVLRRGRNDPCQNDSDAHQPPENSRFSMKRTTFAVPEATRSGLDDIDSSGSVVPVLGDNASHPKMREVLQLKPSWAEASAATSSYSVAPLSSRHTRPAAPMLIYAPARGRGLDDSHAASDNSSHTDDYSIDMLESPVSTVYSFGSEGDDVFPSKSWDDVDSYRSLDYTFLSTTSSDVFGSNRGRNGGAWKQVYGPSDASPISTGQSPLSSGVLFVRNIDPNAMRRMRLDTRDYGARGNNRIRLGVEV